MWYDVQKVKPADGQRVLVWRPRIVKHDQTVWLGYYFAESDRLVPDGSHGINDSRWWMEIPASPLVNENDHLRKDK